MVNVNYLDVPQWATFLGFSTTYVQKLWMPDEIENIRLFDGIAALHYSNLHSAYLFYRIIALIILIIILILT